MASLSRQFAGAVVVVLTAGSGTPAPAQAPTWVTASGGIEFHSNWVESRMGPTLALSIGRSLDRRLQVQGLLTGATRGMMGDQDVTICPPGVPCGNREGPDLALGATVDLILSEHGAENGGYVLGGVGLTRFSGGGLARDRRPAG